MVKTKLRGWIKVVCEKHESIEGKPYFGGTKICLADVVILNVLINYVFNKALNEPVL